MPENRTFLMAEMLSTRLCHDLTGPIGAISNGAEFLEEDPSMLEGALELISTSAAQAVARVQFYRQAYGRINPTGDVSLGEKRQVTEKFMAGGKVALNWPTESADSCLVPANQRMGKLLLNMVIIALSTIMRDGTVQVSVAEEDGTTTLSVVAEGSMIKEDPAVTAILEGYDDVPIDPKTVQVYLARDLAHAEGLAFTVDVSRESVVLTAQKAATV